MFCAPSIDENYNQNYLQTLQNFHQNSMNGTLPQVKLTSHFSKLSLHLATSVKYELTFLLSRHNFSLFRDRFVINTVLAIRKLTVLYENKCSGLLMSLLVASINFIAFCGVFTRS